jgi:transcription-repair coupling factor (superfamily II helicase)
VPNLQSEAMQTKTTPVFDYLHADTVLWLAEFGLQTEELGEAWQKALQAVQTAKDLHSENLPVEPAQKLLTPGDVKRWVDASMCVHFGSMRPGGKLAVVEFGQQPQPVFQRNFDLLKTWMLDNQKAGLKTLVFSENSRQIERLQTIMTDMAAGVDFIPVYQGLSGGFVDSDAGLAFTTEHQLFDKYYRPRSRQRYSSNTYASSRT